MKISFVTLSLTCISSEIIIENLVNQQSPWGVIIDLDTARFIRSVQGYQPNSPSVACQVYLEVTNSLKGGHGFST
ncbi:hypothetical protein GGS23DRAFT_548685 [Durotheca rogersii]|uniref:uncharacterized protein n=1 Tax=Durotheca rogersii TaxID=419775 RepID=UPI00221FFA11|nr:uncharacterized protein GGS23DRAFT_548685 [Durotheca rogersii]KAI5867504.1 hypothetical protein GGS23DRAFT_548685 [Durotheca rogersii]